jgi:tetratricopeptide (TPR) repeat protein
MENLEQGRPRTAQDGGGKGGGARPPKSINTPVIRPQPAQVTSLADGIKAEGLAKVMRQAEDLMKKGRFVSALEQYALAEQVAPNNPFVWLGQAHAELGAGYYLRAAEHLRRALAGEPALMMAQYDLRTMIGQDRLEALVKDLKETAKAQEQNHGLVFLLAYLAYNTSNEQQAAVYLDLAQKRAGGNDDFYRLVRLHWNLPGGDGAILEDPRIPLSEVYKQFELGNVTRATVTDDRIVESPRRASRGYGAGALLPGRTSSRRCDRRVWQVGQGEQQWRHRPL